MKHTSTLAKCAIISCLIVLAPTYLPAQGLIISSNIAVANPPKHITKSQPKAADFNAIFRGFLETEYVDVGKETIAPELIELLKKETSNGLYGRLKIKESKAEGAIRVTALTIDKEQIVAISARVIYQHSFKKTLLSEYIHIVFSSNGSFKEVRKGQSTKQEM